MEVYAMATTPTSSAVSSGTAAAASSGAPVALPAAAGMAVAAFSGGQSHYAREWLYRLVMFPSYFTPCPTCCVTNRTPKREQLLTLFDTQCPSRVLCSHCPDYRDRLPWLLQVRRSAFKDVIKATDILRFGCDTTGIQQYTLNGSKVLYLCREPTPAGKAAPTAAAPSVCAIDGRAMMDKGSVYCSLKCKMHGDDPEFAEWLEAQDPAVKEAAYAAATAPPRPTAACKRAAPNGCPYAYVAAPPGAAACGASPASSGGSAGAARPRKALRNAATEAEGPGAAAGGPLRPPRVSLPKPRAFSRAASAPSPAHHHHHQQQQSAFLPVAVDGPSLDDGWMSAGPLADLDQALSCSTQWGAAPLADQAFAEQAFPHAGVGDWASSPGSATDAGEWWLPDAVVEPLLPAPAPGGSAEPLGAATPSSGGAGAAEAEAEADLLVEWPALGASCVDLYGIATASPGSEAAADLPLLWD